MSLNVSWLCRTGPKPFKGIFLLARSRFWIFFTDPKPFWGFSFTGPKPFLGIFLRSLLVTIPVVDEPLHTLFLEAADDALIVELRSPREHDQPTVQDLPQERGVPQQILDIRIDALR